MFTAIDAGAVGHEVTSMDADKKMTPAEFDALLPRLGRLSLDTVTVARAVFVDGLRPAEAATKHGTSRQRVNAVLRRIEAAKGEYPADWKRVEVWLPPELAAQVEKMAEDARAAIGA